MGTGLAGRRFRQWVWPGRDAGALTGYWISTSRASLTTWITLSLRAVRKHTDCRWIMLYMARWLIAPVQLPDGTLAAREQGTPQGGVISPLLANLFLHYVFDVWMQWHYPSIPFERYADDIIVHCKSERQALWLQTAVIRRLAKCKLELHPEKTKIVYCRDVDRTGNYPKASFDFLGFEFRPRGAKSRLGRYFVSFLPAVGKQAAKSIRSVIRGWRLHRLSDKGLLDLSRMFNPIIRGWINYYGSFYKSALYPLFDQLNRSLKRWAMRKYKRLRGRQRRAAYWLRRIRSQQPRLFAHWQLASHLVAGR